MNSIRTGHFSIENFGPMILFICPFPNELSAKSLLITPNQTGPYCATAEPNEKKPIE